MTDHLLETFEDGIVTLTMNRPEARNALSVEMQIALRDAAPRLANDPKVRVVVLTGAGGAFCSGGDVKGFAAGRASGGLSQDSTLEERVTDLRARMDVSRWLHEMRKPTLAVIPGAAAGAGFSLALACDLRIAADEAKMTTAFAKVGVSGDYGGSWFLPRLVGEAKARELYLLSEVITGAEAARLGIVNRSVPRAELAEAAQVWARRLAALPPIAVAYMKDYFRASDHATLSDQLDREALGQSRTMMTGDHKAAARAFVEGTAPVFHGR